jgi:hypothetical protein
LEFEANSKFLYGLPHPEFGIKELSHWATEEFLVPVESHKRCAFGLRLCRRERPFPFYPREADRFGYPVATGPSQFAFLDCRDHMLEAGGQYSGGPDIIAVLNRNNPKIKDLLNLLAQYETKRQLHDVAFSQATAFRKALKIGRANHYSFDALKRLLSAINELHKVLLERAGAVVDVCYTEMDVPKYFAGGEVIPFGQFTMDEVVVKVCNRMSSFSSGDFRIIMS